MICPVGVTPENLADVVASLRTGMLWSSLCHQGEIDTASYAAVPHLVRVLASGPTHAHLDFFLLPACIEIARTKGHGPEIPADLRDDYFAPLQRIPALAAAESEWDGGYYCPAVAAALAVARGQPALGEAILELEPDAVGEFMEARFG